MLQPDVLYKGSFVMNRIFKLIILFIFIIVLFSDASHIPYRIPASNEGPPRSASDFQVSDNNVQSEVKAISGKKKINVVLLGIEGKARADAIIFISYVEAAGKLSVISIPRDTYFHEEGYDRGDQRKINAVYGRAKEKGCVDAVGKLLGNTVIDYYMSIDYDGVEKVIDAIEGVGLEVPLDMEVGGIRIEKGSQVLYGKEALQYLRFRKKYPDGDLGRIKAQQKLIKTAISKVQYSDMPAIINRAFESINTNMPIKYMLDYAKAYIDDKVKDTDMYMLPGTPMYKNIGGYNWSYYFHNPEEVKELMDRIYGIESLEQKKRKRCEG